VDHPTIANVSGTAREKIAPHHLRFFSKKTKSDSDQKLHLLLDRQSDSDM
jgi:hypothetical protein